MHITGIWTYPIKALRAIELDSAELTQIGLKYDRHFMLIELLQKPDGSEEHKNVAIAHYPESARFFPSISIPDNGDEAQGTLKITFKPMDGEEKSIDIPLHPDTTDLELVDTIMHKSPAQACKMPQEVNDWFSACYGKAMILTFIGSNRRAIRMSSPSNPAPQSNGDPSNPPTTWLSSPTTLLSPTSAQQSPTPEITFTDCAPYLLTSTTSLSSLATDQIPNPAMAPFRPNIILTGASTPWEEDFWAELSLANSSAKLLTTHNCGRCKSINIDYETGRPGTGPKGQMLKGMQAHRRVDPGMKWSPIFGRYAFLGGGEDGEGVRVRVGDEVVVSRRNGERTVFDWEGLCTK